MISAGNFTKNSPFCHATWFALVFALASIVIFSFFSVACVDMVLLLILILATDIGAS